MGLGRSRRIRVSREQLAACEKPVYTAEVEHVVARMKEREYRTGEVLRLARELIQAAREIDPPGKEVCSGCGAAQLVDELGNLEEALDWLEQAE